MQPKGSYRIRRSIHGKAHVATSAGDWKKGLCRHTVTRLPQELPDGMQPARAAVTTPYRPITRGQGPLLAASWLQGRAASAC
jgi:hypothetical protein